MAGVQSTAQMVEHVSPQVPLTSSPLKLLSSTNSEPSRSMFTPSVAVLTHIRNNKRKADQVSGSATQSDNSHLFTPDEPTLTDGSLVAQTDDRNTWSTRLLSIGLAFVAKMKSVV